MTPKSTRTVEGKVLEVRRMSRDVTVRTRQGTLEHVVIPREAAVTAPHGERGLSGIRTGMAVRVEAAGAHKAVAYRIVARTPNGADLRGRSANHRAAR